MAARGALTDVITKIVSGYPNNRIDELLPGPTPPQHSEPWLENNAYC